MIIVNEMPFKFVESKGFRQFMPVACPRFKLPIRWTMAKLSKFKDCALIEKIDCKSLLSLDVSIRWNSTFLMLDFALKFESFEDIDLLYKSKMILGDGLPYKEDWKV